MYQTGKFRESFAKKLFISVAAIMLLGFCLIFAISFWSENRTMRKNMENKGRLLSSILANNAKTGVFAENQDMLKTACESILQSSDVTAIRISDINDRLLYEYRKDGISGDEFRGLPTGSDIQGMQGGNEKMPMQAGRKVLLFTMPISIERAYQSEGLFFSDTPAVMQKDMIGYLHLGLDRTYHERKIRTVILADIAIAAVVLLLGGSLVYWLVRKMVRPLVSLTEAVRSFGKGEAFPAVTVQSQDEVGKLADAFSAMTHSLESKETERRRLEMQFRQAQKMEAVGTMAGGIAHDFKNFLTAISGFSSLAKMSLEKDDPVREYVEHILNASSRAAALVQSLLAFSRQQIISPKVIDLNSIVTNVEKMLRRLIREDIRLGLDLSPERLTVMADAGQIDQILMNLSTNARDAMPHGGTLSISTRSAQLEESFFQNYGVPKPGAYAMITVADTGTGMDSEVMKKIFEPFFTTKDAGRGTGLGLSSVYGIVTQHGGYIDVKSEIGAGTVFSIYLPMVHSDYPQEQSAAAAELRRGSETVLVAEDDEEVRIYIHDILRLFGYTVVEAADGDQAIQIFSQKPGIDLLLLDVVMPGKNGKEVFEAIRAMSPGIKALFLSGHSADIISRWGVLDEGVNFIDKPVSPEELLIKIRNILESGT